jgi:hypothetical protein
VVAAQKDTGTAARGPVLLTTTEMGPARLAKRENVAAVTAVTFMAALVLVSIRVRNMTSRERARVDLQASVVAARKALYTGAQEGAAGTLCPLSPSLLSK